MKKNSNFENCVKIFSQKTSIRQFSDALLSRTVTIKITVTINLIKILRIPLTILYDEYIDRPKLSEQKKNQLSI